MTFDPLDMNPRQADRMRADAFFLIKGAGVLIQRHDCTTEDADAAVTNLEKALENLRSYSDYRANSDDHDE